MKKIKSITLIITMLTSMQLNAQEDLNVTAFQFGLFPPISTNGMYNSQTINRCSLNLLGEYSKANTSVEISGLFNINTDFTRGSQLAGLLNYSGYSRGSVQIAGLTNISEVQVQGVQIAGLSNIAPAGEVNLLVAGLLNVAQESNLEMAGLLNIASQKSNVQISGAVNYAPTSHIQIAGILNAAGKADTVFLQLSGCFNLATDARSQITGGVNAAKNTDLQIAPINIASNNRGLQVGVVNFARKSRGVSVGVVNIILDGKHEIELGVSDGVNTFANLKLGTRHFYNIYSFGKNFLQNDHYAIGYGFGSEIALNDRYGLQFELVSRALASNEFKMSKLNTIGQLSIGISRNFTPWFGIYVAPNLNVHVFDKQFSDNAIAPYLIFSRRFTRHCMDSWIGLSLGTRFSF